MEVTSYWEGGFRCTVPVRDFELSADEPPDMGSDTGPAPTELFLTSLATCFTMAMAFVANRQGIDLSDLAVRVVGEYDGPRFSGLQVEVRGEPSDQLEGLLDKARRVCYVSNTLADPPSISYCVAE